MSEKGSIRIFSARGQVIAMLLHVLSQLPYSAKRSDITGLIRSGKLFALADEDERPYPSQRAAGGDEPRWNTLVAFARQDCVDRAWMHPRADNQWRISELGRQIMGVTKDRFATGKLEVRHGYLWTPKFKKLLCPNYEPSDLDEKRPVGSIYKDTQFSALVAEYVA